MFFDFKKNSAWMENLTLVMQLGLSMALSVVFGFFVGRWIDRWLGTGSIFLVVFTILGVGGGVYLAYRNIMAVMTPENRKKDNEKADHDDGHQ